MRLALKTHLRSAIDWINNKRIDSFHIKNKLEKIYDTIKFLVRMFCCCSSMPYKWPQRAEERILQIVLHSNYRFFFFLSLSLSPSLHIQAYVIQRPTLLYSKKKFIVIDRILKSCDARRQRQVFNLFWHWTYVICPYYIFCSFDFNFILNLSSGCKSGAYTAAIHLNGYKWIVGNL